MKDKPMPQHRSAFDKIHLLKTNPIFFDDIKTGKKLFELRKNDRDFQVGDVLILYKYSKKYAEKRIKDRVIIAQVTYIVFYSELRMKKISGLEKDYCIMQIEVRKEEEK